MQKKKVFVAMSGGVDSSVAALLLRDEGYDVVGIFMQGWRNPRFECTWKEDRQDAARVAAVLDIPFRVLDFGKEYHEHVVSYLIDEYKNGRTPNPDVMCNKEIKFGLFFKWAMEQGGDYIATGHYIRKRDSESPELFVAHDDSKDQSYFLWTLTPEIIQKSLFPVGDYKKSEIRKIAERAGLPTAGKKDSQGICFVGEGSMVDFLRDHIKTEAGPIKTKDGREIGRHEGIEFFTIGQRHGIGAPGGTMPYYVAEKNARTRTLVVAEGNEDAILYQRELIYKNHNWMIEPVFPFVCEARIRYRAGRARCTVFEDGRVVFEKPQRAVAPGQSIVFYVEERMVGGGIIEV
ncbi:MAG: tRNA 2-thiouridine(34) synthase MnmA [Patescibacteria group bacterium]